jgi:galactose mutarotase-like enzyme
MMIRKTLPTVAGVPLGEGWALGEAIAEGAGGLGVWVATWPLVQAAPARQPATARATIRAVLSVKNGRWDLAVIPERGGRVASLRLDGAELLDQGIGVNQPTAKRFVDGGAWGWDEMVPNVDESAWNGVQLPDHGEAWRLPWRVDARADSSCETSCEGRLLPWRLEREISLGLSVRVDYSLSNLGSGQLPAYWCWHALFRYEPAMEVELGARLMRFAEGKSGKFFVPPGSLDRARLRWPNATAVEISWDAAKTPHCGVWICNGDLGGYRQVAIEPATGGGDRPDSDEPPPTLAPGRSLDWWLEIHAL